MLLVICNVIKFWLIWQVINYTHCLLKHKVDRMDNVDNANKVYKKNTNIILLSKVYLARNSIKYYTLSVCIALQTHSLKASPRSSLIFCVEMRVLLKLDCLLSNFFVTFYNWVLISCFFLVCYLISFFN